MKQMIAKHGILALSLLMVAALLFSTPASATGPRVTKTLFSIDTSEVHALDFPPFLSNDVDEGGPFSEIVNTVLQEAGIDAVISTHPLQSMVKYYLQQENALAVMGRHLDFSSDDAKQLVRIPLALLVEQYYYYKPEYPDGLGWNGKLASLQGRTYAAHRGENVSDYKAAGLTMKYGRTIGLLKMLAAGEADFAAIPSPAADWLIDRFMPDEKRNFAAMSRPAGEDVYYIVFNKANPQGKASAQAFRKAFTGMLNDGRYARIMKRHLGDNTAAVVKVDELKRLLEK